MNDELLLKILSLFQLFIAACFLSGCSAPATGSYYDAQANYARRNYSLAFQELWIPVQHNDAKALYAMGYMYYYGLGTEKDQDLGRSLIRRSAVQQYTPAIEALKLINQRTRNQYVPFETYTATSSKKAASEGIWEIKRPLIQGKKA